MATLSLSYGKDSMACIEAIKQLDYPLDRIVHAEIWATDDINADLPPMVEFKEYADKVIKDRYGIEVEHLTATDKNGEKLTYEKLFYRTLKSGKRQGEIYGFPMVRGNWCTGTLKQDVLNKIKGKMYFGIASDEAKRIERHRERGIVLPLVDIGWTEEDCLKWCKENELLSPIYSTHTRGGCWFCHNQRVESLRMLKEEHPELWQILLKWDLNSPKTFKPGHTVQDFDRRFELEKQGKVPTDRSFRWNMIKEEQNEEL